MLVFPQLVDGRVGAVSGDEDDDAADGGEHAGRREHGGVCRSGRGERWDGRLQAKGLTAAEWNAIEALFEAASGHVADVHVSGSGGESAGGERGFRGGRVDQRSVDRS